MSLNVELQGAMSAEYGDTLTSVESVQLANLLDVWSNRYSRNQLRAKYYEGKNGLDDLGISIPPQLRNVNTVVGWPKKAVDMPANRVIFDGYDSTDKSVDDALREMCDENDMRAAHHMATISMLEFGCCAMTVTAGGDDEPDIVINSHDALTCAMLWNWRLKRIACGLSIVDAEYDEAGRSIRPTQVNLWTDKSIVELRLRSGGHWEAKRVPHGVGRCLMEPMVYRPSLTRPFGESRISRAVMSITDSAVRTALRTEVASEFFTAPQRYLLGADVDTFGGEGTSEEQRRKAKLDQYLGTMLAISPNENGDIPQYGQLPQMTMQPHIDYMKSLASRFAGETGIPVHSLGIISDNPASAEALYSATDELIQESERIRDTNKGVLRNVALMALAIQRGTTYRKIKSAGYAIEPNFRSPARVSVAARTDSMMKQVAQFPWMAESDVALEELAYSDDQIQRLKADRDAYMRRQERMEQEASAQTVEQPAVAEEEQPQEQGEPAE